MEKSGPCLLSDENSFQPTELRQSSSDFRTLQSMNLQQEWKYIFKALGITNQSCFCQGQFGKKKKKQRLWNPTNRNSNCCYSSSRENEETEHDLCNCHVLSSRNDKTLFLGKYKKKIQKF